MKQAHVLTRDELKRVLAVCSAAQNGQRNRLAILISHYAGLRVGEIASITWAQVLDAQHVIQPSFYLNPSQTKSNEARQVHLNQLLCRELKSYWAAQGMYLCRSNPIIQSQKGGAFTANTLCQLFTRIYRSAGIKDATSHSGRRWFITRLAHSGVSPKVIMELAGHRQLSTTQRYIDVTADMKSKAVEHL